VTKHNVLRHAAGLPRSLHISDLNVKTKNAWARSAQSFSAIIGQNFAQAYRYSGWISRRMVLPMVWKLRLAICQI